MKMICSDENDMVLYKIDNGVIKAEDDYIQQVEGQSQEQDHDLKSAATLFTLTNCNSYDQSAC